MDYQIVIMSEKVEPVTSFQAVDDSSHIFFHASSRLRGECYYRSRRHTRQQIRLLVKEGISEWMDENLLSRYNTSFSHAGSWDFDHILTFEIIFEDEADAILFFLTFK